MESKREKIFSITGNTGSLKAEPQPQYSDK